MLAGWSVQDFTWLSSRWCLGQRPHLKLVVGRIQFLVIWIQEWSDYVIYYPNQNTVERERETNNYIDIMCNQVLFQANCYVWSPWSTTVSFESCAIPVVAKKDDGKWKSFLGRMGKWLRGESADYMEYSAFACLRKKAVFNKHLLWPVPWLICLSESAGKSKI